MNLVAFYPKKKENGTVSSKKLNQKINKKGLPEFWTKISKRGKKKEKWKIAQKSRSNWKQGGKFK